MTKWMYALCALGLAVIAQPVLADDQGLTGVVREALASNPDVAEARNQWLARREEVAEAEGGFLPSIDLNAGIGYEDTDSPGTRAAYGGSNDLTRKELGLNLTQMLYDGQGTKSEVTRQKARMKSAAARLIAVGESTAISAAEVYVDLGRFSAQREIQAESLKIHQRIQDQIRLRSKAGVGRRADLDQVDSRVALAGVNLIATEVNLRDARSAFDRVIGRMPTDDDVRERSSSDVELPASLDEALEMARSNNPLIRVASADVEAAKAQHEAARQFDYPRFDLEVGSNWNKDIEGIEGRDDDVSAMIRIRYNLFRGGSDAARKRATAYNINEAKDVRDRTVRQLDESVRLAWAGYEATRAQLPLLHKQIESAIATRDAYAKQFNIGQRTLLDVLNSENEVSQARRSVVDATADNLLAQFRLLEAMGALVDRLDARDALATAESDVN